MTQVISRCAGIREPHDAEPVAWIEPCLRCIRRADVVADGPYVYASPPVAIVSGQWVCTARIADQYQVKQ